MLVPVLLFIVGLLFLIKGGDWFVDGASALARRFHLPELLIGATVVSIGTTLPEVMVSTMSAVSGHGEIAYGNAIGSVICNSALIAAITIAVRPGKVDPKTLRVPVAFFFAAAAIYCVAAYAMGEFTRPLGFVMLAMFVAYMVANVLQMKKAPAAAEAEAEAENAGEEMSLTKTLVLLVLGAVLIALGANLLVDNGTLIAQALGVPELWHWAPRCRSWSPPSPRWSRAAAICPLATSWAQTCSIWCWSAVCPSRWRPSPCRRALLCSASIPALCWRSRSCWLS